MEQSRKAELPGRKGGSHIGTGLAVAWPSSSLQADREGGPTSGLWVK